MSMFACKKKRKQLEYLHSDYDNIEHLKRQFRDQIEGILEKLRA